MINIGNLEAFNLEGAFRGLRNPMNSWDKSDSIFGFETEETDKDLIKVNMDWVKKDVPEEVNSQEYFESVKLREMWLKHNGRKYSSNSLGLTPNYFQYAYIGPVDMGLAQRMISAGASDRKFLRQISVCMDIDAPLLWWKEADQYRIATVTNSCSTMHKLASTPITRECFSFSKDLPMECFDVQDTIIDACEDLRLKYNATKDSRYWRALVEILPEGWNQKRTFTCNYETLRTMVDQRKHHRLQEWHDFISELHKLPYADELIFYGLEGVKD